MTEEKKMGFVFYSKEFWGIAIPLLTAIGLWVLNEWTKRCSERRLRKEKSYAKFLVFIEGFYQDSQDDVRKKEEFLKELRLAWLYASDQIIKKANAFLETTDDTRPQSTEKQKKESCQELILAMRKDLYGKKTSLTVNDYKILKVNKK